mmetsp:Transcript_9903/g.19028  ORF Transcript_9903/g.19028 Transcript_9903/m.19028 type:complete len:297 (+) Transcript_9903:2080-2970(+)
MGIPISKSNTIRFSGCFWSPLDRFEATISSFTVGEPSLSMRGSNTLYQTADGIIPVRMAKVSVFDTRKACGIAPIAERWICNLDPAPPMAIHLPSRYRYSMQATGDPRVCESLTLEVILRGMNLVSMGPCANPHCVGISRQRHVGFFAFWDSRIVSLLSGSLMRKGCRWGQLTNSSDSIARKLTGHALTPGTTRCRCDEFAGPRTFTGITGGTSTSFISTVFVGNPCGVLFCDICGGCVSLGEFFQYLSSKKSESSEDMLLGRTGEELGELALRRFVAISWGLGRDFPWDAAINFV